MRMFDIGASRKKLYGGWIIEFPSQRQVIYKVMGYYRAIYLEKVTTAGIMGIGGGLCFTA